MNYSDWAALSQYICVQDDKIKQLESELDSVIALTNAEQQKRVASKAKDKETPSRASEKAQQLTRMKTTIAVIQKPEKILETASLYGPEERRIKNKVKVSSDKELPASTAKQRSTTNTPDDRERAAPLNNSRGLQKSLTMRGGLHDSAARSQGATLRQSIAEAAAKPSARSRTPAKIDVFQTLEYKTLQAEKDKLRKELDAAEREREAAKQDGQHLSEVVAEVKQTNQRLGEDILQLKMQFKNSKKERKEVESRLESV